MEQTYSRGMLYPRVLSSLSLYVRGKLVLWIEPVIRRAEERLSFLLRGFGDRLRKTVPALPHKRQLRIYPLG